MVHRILAGFLAEGSTDYRFLGTAIRRTFEDIALEFNDTIEILDILPLHSASTGFAEQVVDAARQALLEYGMSVLCVHTDADHETDEIARTYKITLALNSVKAAGDICKVIVPVIPVQMMEAWLLADIELLKEQIGSQKTNRELGLHRAPEMIADPKHVIEEAIRIAREDRPKRRRTELKRNDLYQPIGSAISLSKLAMLPSYQAFCRDVRQAFRTLNIY